MKDHTRSPQTPSSASSIPLFHTEGPSSPAVATLLLPVAVAVFRGFIFTWHFTILQSG